MPRFQQFALPDTAEGLTEAEILSWRVQVGDQVVVNQILVEIETAKAAVELPSPWDGVVTELLAEEGQTVAVGTPIITIDLEPNSGAPEPSTVVPDASSTNLSTPANTESNGKIGEEMPGGRIATLVGYGPRSGAVKRRQRKETAPLARTETYASEIQSGSSAEPEAVLTVPLAKPPVRKLAKDQGIDLHTVIGSGPGGVITREDIQNLLSSTPAKSPAATSNGFGERRVPIKGVRKATAQAMVDSAFTAPHVTEFFTIDVTPMMELRERLKNSREFNGIKLTPLAFTAKAVALAIRRTPDINATWDGKNSEIVYKDYLNLGIAAATPRGLVVPKVKNAHQMSLRELAIALDELTTIARDGKTAPEAMLDGTFTITNVGVFGVDTGTPIINPGESAILALGAIRDMPWVVAGEIVVRKICQLALSFDHRVIDGQQGSQFLADVGALLADPGVAMTY